MFASEAYLEGMKTRDFSVSSLSYFTTSEAYLEGMKTRSGGGGFGEKKNVRSLPRRNENFRTKTRTSTGRDLVRSLPRRNENYFSFLLAGLFFAESEAYLEGMKTGKNN